MQVLRQLVVCRPSWRADVQLHADAEVRPCCENRCRTALQGTVQPHRTSLADSKGSSLRLLLQFNTPFPQYQSRFQHP